MIAMIDDDRYSEDTTVVSIANPFSISRQCLGVSLTSLERKECFLMKSYKL